MPFTTRIDVPEMHTFRAHPSALYEIRQFIRQRATVAAFSEQTTNDVLLAVSEACANSIVHTASPEIALTWKTTGDCVEILIKDQGIFKKRVRMPELEGQGGHGIPLMMALVDEMTIREGTPNHPGTLVRLVKCRGI